jgi:hypothetical protein
MYKKILIIILCIFSISGLFYFFYRSSQKAKLNFIKQDKKQYKLIYNSSQTSSSPQLGISDTHLNIRYEGILNFKILEIKDKLVQIAFQFSENKLQIGDKRIEHLEKIQSQFFIGTWTEEGEILEWVTPYTISKKDEFLLLQNLLLFQLSIAGDKIKWTHKEEDSLGEFIAKYNSKSDRILKSKIKYTKIRSEDIDSSQEESNFQSNIQISYYEFFPDSKKSWLKNANFKEKAEINGNSFEIKLNREGSLEEIQFNPDLNLLIWKLDSNYEELKSQLTKETKKELSISEEAENQRLEQEYKKETFLSMFQKNFSNPNQFTDLMKMEKMKEFLNFHKEEALKIPDYLIQDKIKGNQVIEIIHLLATTGHKESQMALQKIMSNKAQSANARMQSIVAFQEVRNPNSESIESLWKIYESRNSLQERDYSNTALLALGTASLNLKKNMSSEKENLSNQIKQRLVKEIQNKNIETNKIPVLIDSIGNTCDSNLFSKIKDFSNSDNKIIRSSVYNSAANFKDKDSLEFLRTSLKSEESPEGRSKIIESLVRRNSKGDSKLVNEILTKEEDINVRKKMIEFLILNKEENPDLKKNLETILEKETNDSIRDLLYQGIYAK